MNYFTLQEKLRTGSDDVQDVPAAINPPPAPPVPPRVPGAAGKGPATAAPPVLVFPHGSASNLQLDLSSTPGGACRSCGTAITCPPHVAARQREKNRERGGGAALGTTGRHGVAGDAFEREAAAAGVAHVHGGTALSERGFDPVVDVGVEAASAVGGGGTPPPPDTSEDAREREGIQRVEAVADAPSNIRPQQRIDEAIDPAYR